VKGGSLAWSGTVYKCMIVEVKSTVLVKLASIIF